ncbi:hypothetical protein BXT86_04230 [candidate division WOR-3 bacterium 4484_100]|uniref:ABC transporter domain-containing protein n=1 Tax=candidate division WOR-3 bacterium 4484_100 TaxID=1936077 RepID=A0A1V4QEV2_UNCW3|nr:MAG: hypothetical protein BXT86_04230 [candidate division WOR-3 bacterium 4484_100]
MLSLSNIEFSIGERILFSGVDFHINPRDRFGLVGPNGAGKTTFLRIIIGEVLPTRGNVLRTNDLNIGYLPQEEIVLKGGTLIDEVLKDYHKQLERLTKLQTELSKKSNNRQIIRAYESEEERFLRMGGYDYEAEAYKVIAGLGFVKEDYEKKVDEFSSGWQMRIVLARILLNRPELLLLDEPTNHLDIESILWLENYLLNFKGAMVVVSHDRYFLDKILQVKTGATGILEVNQGRFRKYRTNYTGYLRESQIRKERLQHQAKVQERRIKQIKEFIMRNRANKSKAKIVKSREKYLEKLKPVEVEKEHKQIKVRFPLAGIYSKRIVQLAGVSKYYGSKKIFENLNLTVEKGERIALLGKNGAGKSTLCRIIAGYEPPDSGVRWSSEKLRIGTFLHEILLKMNPEDTVIETVSKRAVQEIDQNIRKFLGLFLFSGDDIYKKVKVLSGGEKTRLVILLTMIEPSNLLILDEPTYHLDKSSTDAIKQAISSYGGTIILVSHNRDLIVPFATRIIELRDGRLFNYPGDFFYYLQKRKDTSSYKGERRKKKKTISPMDVLKDKIINLETRRNRLRELFSRPGFIQNPRKAKKLFEEYQRLSREIEKLEESS